MIDNIDAVEIPKPTSFFLSAPAYIGYGVLAVLFIVVLITIQSITVFSIQPLGMLPEGKTLIILRMKDAPLFDSADAICERTIGGVSLFCRMAALSAVLKDENIYMRLPYQEWAYKRSVNGVEYDR